MKAVVPLLLVPSLAHADTERVVTRVATAPGEVAPATDLDTPPVFAPAPTITGLAPPAQVATAIESRAQAVGAQRGFLAATALTVPEGTVELSVRAIAPVFGAVGMAGGITSSTELWADVGGLTEIDGGDGMSTYAAGLKQVLGGGATWQIAATGSARTLKDDDDTATMYTVGGVASACASHTCSVMVSAGMSMLIFDENDSDNEEVGLLQLGVSAGGRKVRVMAEYIGNAEGSLAIAGVRFGSATLAAELAVALASDESEGVGIPLLSLMGRL